jgi:hypothetical protein
MNTATCVKTHRITFSDWIPKPAIVWSTDLGRKYSQVQGHGLRRAKQGANIDNEQMTVDWYNAVYI